MVVETRALVGKGAGSILHSNGTFCRVLQHRPTIPLASHN